jgi:hydroxymethylpyrimidine pyrophosphatase-like HAD family hydrolase
MYTAAMNAGYPIKLVVFDIDGVLTEGETSRFDLNLMSVLAGMNRQAIRDASVPAVTLCTGRPAPYVEAMLQAIDGRIPAVFEGGAGMYVPDGYRFLAHPGLGDLASLREARRRLEAAGARGAPLFLQPGKEFTVSVFPAAGRGSEALQALPGLQGLVAELLGPLETELEIAWSASCLNLQPKGCNKASGIDFLAELTGIAPSDMLGVGDSAVDLPFLARVGRSAAPANAGDDVKKIAGYVAASSTSQGVREILAHFGLSPAG